MATDKEDYTKIEINIAGEPLFLSVPFSKQISVRNCEREINALYADWRARFPRKTPTELLAMIAYQYASFFFDLKGRMASLTNSMEAMSAELSRILDDNPKDQGD
ncbi:MAG: cell division protein ZapA [Muribaculaceae bacterium]|nr:cell division protein ZapA [Muribaculaceae bacterium]